MKIALLGTGSARPAPPCTRGARCGRGGCFGRTPEKLAKIGGRFGFAAMDLDVLLADASVDLADICRCRMALPLSAVVLLLA